MQNYKIIKVLKTFSKKEFKKFGEYVHSPYFNKNESVRLLYDALSKYYPDFKSAGLDVKKMFAKVFPKIKYDYFKINNIVSDLYKLSENYIHMIGIDKTKNRLKYILLQELTERGLEEIYENIEKNLKKEIENSKTIDENYYYDLYKFYTESLDYNVSKKPGDHPKIIQAQFDNFLNYSNVTLMKLYMYMHHLKKQNTVEFNMEMFENFISYVKEKNFEDNPAYMIYKGIMVLELEKTKENFLNLKKAKEKYSDRISSEDFHNALLFMHSYSAEMINKKGDESYKHEEFQLVKEMIDRKIFTPVTIIYPNLINIFKSACEVQEYEWAENFLNKFIVNIPEKDKANTINCCYGYMNYRKQNFTEALDCFAKTNFQWFILKMFVKTLTLRIYYENGMFDQAYSFIDSFRHYLNNDRKIVEYHKSTHNKFLKYLTSLIKIKSSVKSDSLALDELKDKIDKMENNSFGVKKWLQRKVDEIK